MLRAFAVLLGVLAAVPAHALSIAPITVEMTSSGRNARAVVTITNNSNEAAAIEPTFERVTILEDGAVIRKPVSGESFLVLPLQTMVPPGATQTFRIQWVGAPDIPQSESYFITFNQLPVQGLAKKTGITLLAAFSVAVNVAPTFAKPHVDLVTTNIDRTQHTPRPAITVQNPSPVHALLKHAAIIVHADGIDYQLEPLRFEHTYGNGLLQPWAKRRFVLPVDLPPGTKAVTATMTFNPPGP